MLSKKCGNLHYAIMYNVIWANQKTESFEYHWLRTLAMFDVTSFPTILSVIGCQFMLCRYVNYWPSIIFWAHLHPMDCFLVSLISKWGSRLLLLLALSYKATLK